MARAAKYTKRPDGNYCTQITVGRREDGKPIRKTIYAKTIKELEKKRFEYEQQMAHGTLSSDEKMTFATVGTLWLEKYKPTVSHGTRQMYRSILNKHLLPALGTYKLTELKMHHLQALINELAEDGFAEKTMIAIRQSAVQILEIAVENDILHRNVFSRVKVPSVAASERRALTSTETALITQNWQGHRMGIPAMILLRCGLRRGELLALNWKDIDLESKRINVSKSVYFDGNTPHIKTPKSKAGIRSVPIPDSLIPLLQNAPRTTLFVCPSAKGVMMSEIAFRRAWQSYMHYLNIRAGGHDASRSRPKLQVLDKLTPHMFRHTYATTLYDAGVDVKSAQAFLGHADLQVTLSIYTHLSDQKETKAIDALNAHLKFEAVQ